MHNVQAGSMFSSFVELFSMLLFCLPGSASNTSGPHFPALVQRHTRKFKNNPDTPRILIWVSVQAVSCLCWPEQGPLGARAEEHMRAPSIFFLFTPGHCSGGFRQEYDTLWPNMEYWVQFLSSKSMFLEGRILLNLVCIGQGTASLDACITDTSFSLP